MRVVPRESHVPFGLGGLFLFSGTILLPEKLAYERYVDNEDII